MKFEPLIIHLFKLFTRAFDLKKEDNKTATAKPRKGEPLQPATDYNGQNENMVNNKMSS